MVKYKVTLTKEERELLMANTRKGSHTAKKVIHSLILLNLELLPTFRQLTFKDTFDFLSRPWPGKENYAAIAYNCSGLL